MQVRSCGDSLKLVRFYSKCSSTTRDGENESLTACLVGRLDYKFQANIKGKFRLPRFVAQDRKPKLPHALRK